jgi:hypothetical protein
MSKSLSGLKTGYFNNIYSTYYETVPAQDIDYLAGLTSNVQQQINNLTSSTTTGGYFLLWAETPAGYSTSSSGYQWSYGSAGTNSTNVPIVMGFSCNLIYFNVRSSAIPTTNASIQIIKNGSVIYTVSGINATSFSVNLSASGLSFVASDTISIATSAGAGGGLIRVSLSFSSLGVVGATGQGFNYRSTYVSASTYNPYDVVYYNGSSYNCILSTTGNVPTNTTYWSLFAMQGLQGNIGPTGATGQGFNWRSNYNSMSTYNPYDVVYYNGSSYINILSCTNYQPDSNPTYWTIMTLAGQTGPQGSQGPQGSTGDSGLDAFFTLLGLSGTIASNLATISSVNSSIATIEGEIGTLQSEVSTLEDEVSTLQQQTQYQSANNTTPTTSFASDVVVTDNTGLTTEVHLSQTGLISANTLSISGLGNIGNTSTNTDTTSINSNTLNLGTSANSTVNVGCGTSFSTINITGLNINMTGIVTINGIPFINGSVMFSGGINQGF